MAQPSAQEQYMLELVNRARENPNEEAARYGINLNQGLSAGTISSSAKQPLVFNQNLIESSREHSEWMLETNTFSHTGNGGSSAGDRMRDANYSFTGSWTWGENIAWRGSTGTIDETQTIGTQHEGLFKSSGHRTNILNDNFREIGIGAVTGNYNGYNALMTTQNFAKSGNSVFLTGVAFDDAVQDDDFYTVGEGLGGIQVEAVRSDGQSFTTTTFASGGYQLALAPGEYSVNFSGGSLGQTVQRDITIGQKNIKVDLATDELAPAQPSAAPSPEPDSAPEPEAPASETPAPAPEAPTPESPAPEAPAPEAPAPEAPAPESPAPESPAPESPAPEAPAPESPISEAPTPAPTPEPTAEPAPLSEPSLNQIQGTGRSDRLIGTAEADEIVGVRSNSRNPGRNERDMLMGGGEGDRFILGDSNQVYYTDGDTSSYGTGDFAYIRDFNMSEGDVIQLHGEASDYRLGSCCRQDMSILFHNDGGRPEVVGVIRSQDSLSLTSDAFEFV